MESIPDGDWYCHECKNKANGEKNCIVCGKRPVKNFVICEHCPRIYHADCLNPPLLKVNFYSPPPPQIPQKNFFLNFKFLDVFFRFRVRNGTAFRVPLNFQRRNAAGRWVGEKTRIQSTRKRKIIEITITGAFSQSNLFIFVSSRR